MNKKLLLITGALVFSFVSSFAKYDEAVENLKKKLHKTPRLAAECAPATTVDYLNFNNVNALIETGGRLWQDRPNGASAYEVPQFSGQTAIFSGALWMGGTDVNAQLKIAAATYGLGVNDFWTGPLTTDGSAEITPDVCRDYDRFFHISRQEVVDFIDWWNCIQNAEPPVECKDRDFSDYKVPKVILEWPAHGDVSRGQDFYLAPFFDAGDEPNFLYDPINDGDYPYYDLNGDIDCRAVRDIRLFGDDTYWWIFNDKGNIHTSTNGQSIGMEVRAQAFAFATNDEVNDMTFYNYELINRSTFTLFNTYFGQWVDPDLGCANDDYVGCDVERGLGFCYNGDQFDEDCLGAIGYGSPPAAIGIDFFEGPYQDNDSINNLKGIGKNEALNGIGYRDLSLPLKQQDSVVDNERFGMRRFVYYDRGGNALRGDPVTALHHYNYLQSVWKDGSKMVFGGNGHPSDPNSTNIETEFMFPGTSDPLNWGTKGVDPGFIWTELTAGNPPFDRRFIQSAGPFTLKPGAVNDITVGVVFAHATSGDNYASVEKIISADRKAQALFDNCFDVLDGPDAPDLSGVELNKEIILVISNKKGISNNFKKFPGDYEEEDPFIITPDGLPPYDNEYRFQGYQIYQVSDASVSVSDIGNEDKSRLAFQTDLNDEIGDLINYEFNEELKGSVPTYKVRDAANDGIKTTFRVTNDLFAEEDPRLVNFKTYFFIAIAYAHNEYKPYTQDNPEFSDGQKLPYISSRKGTAGAIKSVAFTPHPQEPKYGGMKLGSSYGDEPEITRIEGQGNGGVELGFTDATLIDLLNNSATPGANQPTYKSGMSPIVVKVIDPTNVLDGKYTMRMFENASNKLEWKVWREGGEDIGSTDTVYSQSSVNIENEQIIADWGVSISVKSVKNPNALIGLENEPDINYKNGIINSSITYSDSTKSWLAGVQDLTGSIDQNWIRSGTAKVLDVAGSPSPDPLYNSRFKNYTNSQGDVSEEFMDPFSLYQGLIGGTWAPYRLVAYSNTSNGFTVKHAPAHGFNQSADMLLVYLENLQSVNVVFTDSTDLWTRCPVVELQDDPNLAIGNAEKGSIRLSPSVDKNGIDDGTGMGMGWFPGYAINVETGERLNMAFGEDSWLGDANGADMLWNPTSVFEKGFTGNPANPGEREVRWGGKHYIYVFGNTDHFAITAPTDMPFYDEGLTLYGDLSSTSQTRKSNAFATCLWVGMPMLESGKEYLASDATISLNVDKPYSIYESDSLQNGGLPMYRWDMSDLKTRKNVTSIAENALSTIRVVPNPYYAFAEHYEQSQLDNFVKITNLPERCTVSIYNVSGTLIRKFNKSDPSTEIKWDLVNQSEVPIAGGLYLIHVDAPGVGEIIVKWFGVLRPVDLQGF